MNVSMLSENLFLLFLRERYLQVLFYAIISNCDQKQMNSQIDWDMTTFYRFDSSRVTAYEAEYSEHS